MDDNNKNASQTTLHNHESSESPEIQWSRIRARLRGELGEATFNSWFKSLELHKTSKHQVTLRVSTRFIRSWIESHYLSRILEYWNKENTQIQSLDFIIEAKSSTSGLNTSRSQKVMPAPALFKNSSEEVSKPPQNPISSFLQDSKYNSIGAPLDPRYTFDNFLTGSANELAYAAARRVAEEQNNSTNFNPLFLYGGVGLGKTHLMHAIAWEVRNRAPQQKVLYISAEQFMYQFIRALRFKNMITFKEQFREVDMLMVDDIQFISGKESTQEEFFHTFNTLLDCNKQIVISADQPPSELQGLEERIRSRLGGGLTADIQTTDYELRLRILQKKYTHIIQNNNDIEIPSIVFEFLAQRITSNVRVLEGALNRIVAFASFNKKTITLDSAKDILRDLLRSSERRVTIGEIQRKVSEYYSIRMGDMLSARRSRVVARPRQIAMYIAKQLTTRSLPEIGRKFGGRDHTTVIHAVKKVEELRSNTPTLDEDVSLLLRSLEI